MKTKLLYITSFLLVFFASCSVDENGNEPAANQQEEAVKNLFDSFSKSVLNSPSYLKFIEGVQVKSSSGLTEDELRELEQEFLSKQSSEFVALYNYVAALNLSEVEIRNIVTDYLSVFNNRDSEECALADTGDGYSLLALIVTILCDRGDSNDNDNQDENED